MSVDRAVVLGNKLLKLCRAHLRQNAGAQSISSDPLFALSYVLAEFIAATSASEADIEAGVDLARSMIRDRAVEVLPGVIKRRKRRMN